MHHKSKIPGNTYSMSKILLTLMFMGFVITAHVLIYKRSASVLVCPQNLSDMPINPAIARSSFYNTHFIFCSISQWWSINLLHHHILYRKRCWTRQEGTVVHLTACFKAVFDHPVEHRGNSEQILRLIMRNKRN